MPHTVGCRTLQDGCIWDGLPPHVAHRSPVQSAMATAGAPGVVRPAEIVGNDYLVLGTEDLADWLR
jgi:hypothetical protein